MEPGIKYLQYKYITGECVSGVKMEPVINYTQDSHLMMLSEHLQGSHTALRRQNCVNVLNKLHTKTPMARGTVFGITSYSISNLNEREKSSVQGYTSY